MATTQQRKKKRRRRRNPLPLLLLALIVVIAIIIIIVVIATRHKHTPGPEATCTTDQVCTDCGEVIQAATGHTPGADATCTEAQICTVCNEVLQEALGHDVGTEATCSSDAVCSRCGEVAAPSTNHSVDADGVCTMCNERIMPEGATVHKAGANGNESDTLNGQPEETATGHYNASGSSYKKNAVLICGDYGMEYFNPSTDGCSAWATVINKFSEKYPDLHVSAMIVPKCTAYQSPADKENPHDNIHEYIQNTYAMLNDGITGVDAMAVMDEHADEYMFYRTDHHWTSLGAYYASKAYVEANNMTAFELDSYETSLRTGFVGTLHMYSSKDSNLTTNPDYTVFHYPHSAYTMQYSSNGSSWNNGDIFNTKTSSYASAYIMGDQPIEVFTSENTNGKVLMLFKESYGNCYAPYMIDYYSKVVVVDIRESGSTIQNLVNQFGVTDVLFLNNCQAVSSLTGELSNRCMN